MTFFSAGFRPFFFSAALYGAVALAIWLRIFGAGDSLLPDSRALAWHVHEMLFGYLSAVMAGFLLTAIPNWTGRPGLTGVRLGMLFLIWCLGRVLMIAAWPSPLAATIDGLFLLLLSAYGWQTILAAGNRRNIIICVLITLLALANISFHIEVLGSGSHAFGQRAALAVFMTLMTVVGGRITPAFTGNWLRARNVDDLPAPFGRCDLLTVAVTIVATVCWVVAPRSVLSAGLLSLAGAMHFVRLGRWRTRHVCSEPLLWILHAGYAWLALAILLLGMKSFFPQQIPGTMAVHAFTAGAAGVLPIAVMTRATLGHTGRALHADRATIIVYGLIIAGAVARVLAPFFPGVYITVVSISGTLWCAGFLLFCIVYGRYLLLPATSEP